jgi:DNA repair exonuclease SbcCD nuclease subunit
LRFLHAADVHLGYQQYNSKERFNDFGRAFLHIVDQAGAGAGQAREQRADFVLLAGDLFEKRTVDPLAMYQAVDGLRALQGAGIPVIAVEGNHERAHYRDQLSWLEFLDGIGLLTLLDAPLREGRLALEPHAPEEGGAYVDLAGGVRVYGLRYYGAATERVLALFEKALSDLPGLRPAYSILLMHAGLEGILPRCSGAAPRQALEPLRPWIDYVALGHIHKPYEVDGWIYNPGSLETWAMDEVSWTDRGYYAVELSTRSAVGHRARLIPTARRHFERLCISVETCPAPQAVYDVVQAALGRVRLPPSDQRPVVEVTLEGTLPFDRSDLDLGYVETMAREALDPLLVRVQNATVPSAFQVNVRQGTPRAELEQQVLSELIERDSRYRQDAAAWARVALDLKRLALEGSSPEAILEHLRRRWSEIAAAREP